MFGLDGVELAILITFACLLTGILSGFPVAFALGGSAVISFVIIALLSTNGVLVTADGEPLIGNIGRAFERNPGFVPNRIFESILGGPSVDVLLAVPLFVLMGIALEKSKVADDLLTTMAKLFGPLPGGLAISVVVVGALLAASTGIVGATVVTMGLLALPTMLNRGYSPSLASGTICTSGTLGQIIPPSIVLVLLGQQVGEIYAEYHPGEVVSVGTLFKGAILPGLMLVGLYISYILVVAFLRPALAPAVQEGETGGRLIYDHGGSAGRLWLAFLLPPLVLIGGWTGLSMIGVVGAQMPAPGALGFVAAPISTAAAAVAVFVGLMIGLGYALFPRDGWVDLCVGLVGVVLLLIVAWQIPADMSPGQAFLRQMIPLAAVFYGVYAAGKRLRKSDIVRVLFPPIVLIVAVLGSILGGIANPTAAAGLGAGGAIMLAAVRASATKFATWPIQLAGASALLLVALTSHFDLRMGLSEISAENLVAISVAVIAFHAAMAGFVYAIFILIARGIMTLVVRETMLITSMVFLILIGSQLLNLVLKSYGGDSYIQAFLTETVGSELQVLLLVLVVIFVMGFVLDFLEIIYIVIPIVGPVLFGGDLDPVWVTILIAINLQTSFLTPPFGFALFYLRGVADRSVQTRHIYGGVFPFVVIQVLALVILWFFPQIATTLPALLPEG